MNVDGSSKKGIVKAQSYYEWKDDDEDRMRQADEVAEMREQAVKMRLRAWLNLLTEIGRKNEGSDAILNCALDAAISIGHADMGNVQLFNRRRRDLEIKTQRGFKQPFLDFFHSISDDSTPCGVALKKCGPVVVQDITDSSVFLHNSGLEVLLDAGVRSVLSTPLIGRTGRVLGILSVHYRQPHHFSDRDMQLMSVLAGKTASLIEKHRGHRNPGNRV